MSFNLTTTEQMLEAATTQRMLMEDMSTSTEKSLASVILFNIFLFLLIFGLSATVDVARFRAEFRNSKAILTGIVMQFFVMPFLGFLSITCFTRFGFNAVMGRSLLVVTSSPGGTMSNWFCSIFNMDLALSVAMTAVSTICSLFMLPLSLYLYNLALYGNDTPLKDSLDWPDLLTSLAIVIGAILSGLLASHYKVPTVKTWCGPVANISGLVLAGLSVWLMGGASYFGYSWSFYVATALPCLGGLILSTAVSLLLKLQKPQVMTISIECCFQNALIATSVAVNMFANQPQAQAQALAVPIFYALVQSLVSAMYCLVGWKNGWTKAPKNEKLCVVLTNNYQVQHEHDDHDVVDDDDDGVPTVQLSSSQEEETTPIKWWRRPFVPRFPLQQVVVEEDDDDEEAIKAKSDTTSDTASQLSDEDMTVMDTMHSSITEDGMEETV